MKCTCKDWEHWSPIHNILVDTMKFCPWCGAPLLPDPVEKTEWWVNDYRFDTETEAVDYANCYSVKYSKSYTFKSITTIERVLKVVKPK